MQKIRDKFNYRKATQALNYLAMKEGGVINKMKALKLIYLADRYHLRKYGRLITDDSYLAMKRGPVPSGVRDIAGATNYRQKDESNYSSRYIAPCNRLEYQSIKPVDEAVFSESDLEALNFAWNTFGKLSQFELAKLTHAYPEWKKHKGALETRPSIPMLVDDFLQDPDANIEKCFELSNEDRVLRLQQLAEVRYVESLWR